jgi:hypothetical protein
MMAVLWSTTDLALLAVCAVLGLLASGFFVAIFVADARDVRRRAQAKQAFRRARKHFAVTKRDEQSERE